MADRFFKKVTENDYNVAIIRDPNLWDMENEPTTIILTESDSPLLSKNTSNHTSGQLTGDGWTETPSEEFYNHLSRIGTVPSRPPN